MFKLIKNTLRLQGVQGVQVDISCVWKIMKKMSYFKKKVQSSEMLHKLHNIVNKITQYYKILFTRIHTYTSG